MDDRKKEIRALEGQKRESAAALEALLERLGGALAPRMRPEPEEYLRLLSEEQDAREKIEALEATAERARELDDEIRRLEQDQNSQNRETSRLYARIGELILERDDYAAYAGPFRERAEALIPKIRSLESRIGASGEKEGNVFLRIGRGAQELVLRSFLNKNRNNLEGIYAACGEHFALHGGAAGTTEIEDTFAGDGPVLKAMGEIEGSRRAQEALLSELTLFREERRTLHGSLSAGGGLARQIQGLEGAIARVRQDTRTLYRRYGAEAEAEGRFEDLLDGADRETLEELRRLRETLKDREERIDRLNTAIALDEEREALARMEKSIEEYRRRIGESERAIADLNRRMGESRQKIDNLSARLEA